MRESSGGGALVLCLDGGSSSLKFGLYRTDAGGCTALKRDEVPAAEGSGQGALERAIERLGSARVELVGHRIVFGGNTYYDPVEGTPAVLRDLETLVDIEPLHMRAELDMVYAARRLFPSAVQVLCFDTAFHRGAPALSHALPLPAGIDPLLRRYGYHGLSYEYVAGRLGGARGRTIVAHLGSGASLCALRDGVPVDTTMGFSALGGLMMGTRPGDLDPGVVLRLVQQGFDAERLSALLYGGSGLLGVSGTRGDMKALLEAAARDDRARAAVELFDYQLCKHAGSMVAVLGGLDRLVFTGGIGERAPAIRAALATALAFLGVELDEEANLRDAPVISTAASRVEVRVIPTDENAAIARHAHDFFFGSSKREATMAP